jgi:hypothetical protein
METPASSEGRFAPLPYPTANERPYGSVRGVSGNWYPCRDRLGGGRQGIGVSTTQRQ